MERHTHGDLLRPVVRGTRAPVPEKIRPEPDAMWQGRRNHDYTYGLSRASLRPVVADEEDTSIPVKPKPRPKPKPKRKRGKVRRIQRTEEHIRFEVATPEEEAPGVTMPEDDDTPWWMDEDILVSRNEDMLAELLSESQ